MGEGGWDKSQATCADTGRDTGDPAVPGPGTAGPGPGPRSGLN